METAPLYSLDMAYDGIFRPESDHERLAEMGITDDDVIKSILAVGGAGQAKHAAFSRLTADKNITDPEDLAFIEAVMSKFPLRS